VAEEPLVRARLPWLLLALWLLLSAVSATFYATQGEWIDVLIAPALGVLAGVGAVLAGRRPGNPIGWLLLTVALLIAVSAVAQGLYTDAESDPRPGLLARCLVWFDNWVFYVWIWLIGILVPLVFPDGRLPSPRWRGFVRLSAAAVGVAVLGNAFGSPTIEFGTDRPVANPLRIPGAIGDAFEALTAVDSPLFTLMFLVALGGLALRLRRSSGVERLQLKWVAFAMGLIIVGIVGAALGELVGVGAVGDAGWSLLLASLIVGLPLAIGVAVMRYRLYDIDVVINRALVYGSLTVTLASTYLGLVLLAGLAVGESDLAVAGSTLAVAALFGPARARIQALVDRRFYRRRYDAAQTLEGFSARLRDELDLETLAGDVRGIVRETVQPAHVSLWLRERS
jgi:hypothetical protein